MLWELGTYELLGDDDFAHQHARGDIKFMPHGDRLKGAFAMVRLHKPDSKDWLRSRNATNSSCAATVSRSIPAACRAGALRKKSRAAKAGVNGRAKRASE